MSNWWEELYEEPSKAASQQDAWWDELYEEETPQNQRVKRRLGRLPERPSFDDEPRLPEGIEPGRTPQGPTEERTLGAATSRAVEGAVGLTPSEIAGQAVDAIKETDFGELGKDIATFAADTVTYAPRSYGLWPEALTVDGASERDQAFSNSFKRGAASVATDTIGGIQRQIDTIDYRSGGELPDYMQADFESEEKDQPQNPRIVDRINDYLDEKLSIPKGYKDSFSANLGGALGSMAAFVAPGAGAGGAAARVGGAAAKRLGRSADEVATITNRSRRAGQYGATAPIAVSLSTEEAYNRAFDYANQNPEILNGLTPEEFAVEKSLNPTTVVSGLVQIANIERLIGPMLSGVGKKAFVNYLADLGVAGTSEFVVESAGAILQNLNERGYNVDQDLFERAFQQGGYGFLSAIGLRGATLPYSMGEADGGSVNQVAQALVDGENPQSVVQNILSTIDESALSEAEAQGNFDIDFDRLGGNPNVDAESGDGAPFAVGIIDAAEGETDSVLSGNLASPELNGERVMPVGIPDSSTESVSVDGQRVDVSQPENRRAFDLSGLDLTQSGNAMLVGLQDSTEQVVDGPEAVPTEVPAENQVDTPEAESDSPSEEFGIDPNLAPLVRSATSDQLPSNFQDPRLKRRLFRRSIVKLSQELIAGGGITYMPREGAVPSNREPTGSLFFDYDATDIVRTKSDNPQWFQSLAEETGISVRLARNAVKRALEGKKLGVRQQAVVERMLDEIQLGRAGVDPNFGPMYETWQDMLADYRNARRARRGQLTDQQIDELASFERFQDFNSPDVYAPEMDQDAKFLMDLALDMGDLDVAIAMFEANQSEQATIEAIWQEYENERSRLAENETAGAGSIEEAEGPGDQPTGLPPEAQAQEEVAPQPGSAVEGEAAPQPESVTDQTEGLPDTQQADIEPGAPTASQQALEDRRVAVETQMQGQRAVDMLQGDGELFAGPRPDQANLLDQADDSSVTPSVTPQDSDGQADSVESSAVDSEASTPEAQSQPGAIEAFGDDSLDLSRPQDRQRSLEAELTADDIEGMSLAQIWPKSEIDAIEDAEAAAFMTAIRNEIPSKPRKTYKKKAWAEKVVMLRDLANMYESGRRDELVAKMEASANLKPLLDKATLLSLLPRKTWTRVESVVLNTSGNVKRSGVFVEAPMSVVKIDGRHRIMPDITDAESVAQEVLKLVDETGSPGPAMKFEVRRRRSDNSVFISKQGDQERRSLAEFDTSEEAFAYIRSNREDLEQAWEEAKNRTNVKKADVRRAENRERTGKDHRGDRDVTTEEFVRAFGLRHVDFGNWVSQGRQAKQRQSLLNEAFDAFMDLSDLLGVPSQAIGLNGELIITLGKRGSGSASAHFEPDMFLINLTKTRGAGSLAHEWFHALDNYFRKQRGDVSGSRDGRYITYRPEPMMVHRESGARMTRAQLKKRAKDNPSADYFSPDNWMLDPEASGESRPEVEALFANLVETLDQSPMTERSKKLTKGQSDGYWSRIIERAARAFEVYIIDGLAQRGYQNDFLANVADIKDFPRDKDRYPYLLPEEIKPVADAFDALFNELQTRETGTGVALYSVNDEVELSYGESGTLQDSRPESRFGRLQETSVDEARPGAVQGELFLQPSQPSEKRNQIARRVRAERVGTFRSGIERVQTPADAAHVVAPLRKRAAEVFGFLVADADGKPLAFKRHTIGTVDASQINLLAVGELYSVPDAAQVWMVHNHPSGRATQSNADRTVLTRINEMMRNTGLKFRGSVVVAPGGQYSYQAPPRAADQSVSEAKIEAANRRFDVPVEERVLRAVPSQEESLSSPHRSIDYVSQNYPGQTGVLFLNTQHQPMAFYEMDPDAMGKLRTKQRDTGFGMLAQTAEGLNSAAAIVVHGSPDERGAIIERVQNVGGALRFLEVRILDGIHSTEDGSAMVSLAVAGEDLTADAFYSLAEPAPTFYSAVARAVETIPQDRAQPQQWLAMLQKQPGVKKEELDWLGLADWLEGQEGTVSREDVLQFVRDNEVKVTEVMRQDALSTVGLAIENGYRAVFDESRDSFVVLTPDGEVYRDLEGRVIGALTESSALLIVGSAENLRGELVPPPDKAVQYGAYQMPGLRGRYRELLLTLPKNNPSVISGEFEANTDIESPSDAVENLLTELSNQGLENLDYGADVSRTTVFFNEVPIQYWRQIEGLAAEFPGRLEVTKKEDPFSEETYQSNHFVGIDNIVAHARFSTRVDADGVRTLLTEEIQSDWHQAGRRKGYANRAMFTPEAKRRSQYDELYARFDREEITKEQLDTELQRLSDRELGISEAVPDAPFKQSWPLLTFKRLIRYAADNGFDKIAWTPGSVQAERYDLGKVVDMIRSSTLSDGYKSVEIYMDAEMGEFESVMPLTVDSNGRVTESPEDPSFVNKGLDEVVGKDLAEQIMSDSGTTDYSGNDLRVGGDGMVAFYDRILKNQVQKYVKKFGAQVGTTQIDTQGATVDVWSVDVTDAMREAAMSGQPMFQTNTDSQSVPDASSVESFKKALGEKAFEALEKSGFIRIVDGLESVPGTHPPNAAAVYLDGVAYINTRMVPKGRELGLVLHEIGVHKGLKDFVGKKAYKSLSDQLMAQVTKAEQGDASQAAQDALRAYRRAQRSAQASANYYRLRTGKEMSSRRFNEILTEETWAYMAEAGSSSSLLQRFIAAIKKALRSLGIKNDLIGGMTNAEIAAIAHGSVARIVDEVNSTNKSYYTGSAGQTMGAQEGVAEPASAETESAPMQDGLNTDEEIRYSVGEDSADANLPGGVRIVPTQSDLDGSPLMEGAPTGDVGAVFDPESGEAAFIADRLTIEAPRIMAQFLGYKAPDDLIGRVLTRRLNRLAGEEGTVGGVFEPEFYGNENVEKALKTAKDYMLETHNIQVSDDHASTFLKAYFNKPTEKQFVIVDGEGGGQSRETGDAIPERYTTDQTGSPVLRDKLGSRWFNEWTRLFESAADNFENTTGLEHIGVAIRDYFDAELGNRALLMTEIRPALKAWKRLSKTERVAAERAFGNYFKAWTYEGNPTLVYDNAPQAAKDLIDAWLAVADKAGTMNQEAGIQVLDENGWRPIGKVAAFWPRMLSDLTQRTLATVDPLTGKARDAETTEHWQNIVNALLADGLIEKAEEAMDYIRKQSVPTQVVDDFFSGIEMARKKALPDIFYDWSLMPALNYIDSWSTRYSQIVHFGQKTDTQQDIFDQALDGPVFDARTRRYIREAQSRIYNVTPSDGLHRFMAAANLIATGTQLANIATAGLNLIGGSTLNWMAFGEVASLKSYAELGSLPVKTFREMQDIGVLRDDILKVVQDFGETPSKGTRALAQATSNLLKIGGYLPTEYVIRMHAAIAAKHYLLSARKAYAKNPRSNKTLQARAFIERLGLDFDRLMIENGEYFEKYLRVASNLTQGTYRIDQTPIFVDTAAGRFLFKYQKFGTQVNRLAWRMHIKPFLETVKSGGEKVSTGERVKSFKPLVRYIYASAIGGAAIVNMRDMLFDYGQPGPDEDELEKALYAVLEDDDRARALGIIAAYIYHSMTQAGAFGFIGNYAQWALDFTQQTRVKSPLDPPGLAPLDLAMDFALTFLGQGTVTIADANRMIERYFSLYRTVKRPAIKAIGMANEEAYSYQLQSANKDRRYLSGLAARWAKEEGLAEGRSIANATFIPNKNKPYTRKIVDGIRAGYPERARATLQQAQKEMDREDYESLIRSARSSVRRGQPLRLNGSPMSESERAAFLRWAKDNVGDENYQRILEAHRKYIGNARQVGLMR